MPQQNFVLPNIKVRGECPRAAQLFYADGRTQDKSLFLCCFANGPKTKDVASHCTLTTQSEGNTSRLQHFNNSAIGVNRAGASSARCRNSNQNGVGCGGVCDRVGERREMTTQNAS
jgi:hypothetical protein